MQKILENNVCKSFLTNWQKHKVYIFYILYIKIRYQYSEARKSYVTGLIDILNGLPVQNICGLNQDIMTLARTGRDGSSLVLTVNLSTEPVRRMKLRVFDVKSVEILSPNGRFVSVPFEHDGEWVSFGCPLVCCQAAVARLR